MRAVRGDDLWRTSRRPLHGVPGRTTANLVRAHGMYLACDVRGAARVNDGVGMK